MQRYCRYHDIILCGRHAEDCLGGSARCNAAVLTDRDRAALQLDPTFCSVCAGVILSKDDRSKQSGV